jgi:hypothetical protein
VRAIKEGKKMSDGEKEGYGKEVRYREARPVEIRLEIELAGGSLLISEIEGKVVLPSGVVIYGGDVGRGEVGGGRGSSGESKGGSNKWGGGSESVGGSSRPARCWGQVVLANVVGLNIEHYLGSGVPVYVYYQREAVWPFVYEVCTDRERGFGCSYVFNYLRERDVLVVAAGVG